MMTQAELAETLGVTQITISRSEQGETFCEFYVIKQGKEKDSDKTQEMEINLIRMIGI